MTGSDKSSSTSQNARSAILGRLSSSLTNVPYDAVRETSIENLQRRNAERYTPSGPSETKPQLIEKMQRNLIATDAIVPAPINRNEIPECVSSFMHQHNMPRTLHIGSDSIINVLDWASCGISLETSMPIDEGSVSLTRSLAGAAETGTLFFISGKENPAAHNFTATTHIAIIDEATIYSTYEQAFDEIHSVTQPLPRSLMMISGPSRTADIEQSLTLGAHGPTTLLVVIYN